MRLEWPGEVLRLFCVISALLGEASRPGDHSAFPCLLTDLLHPHPRSAAWGRQAVLHDMRDIVRFYGVWELGAIKGAHSSSRKTRSGLARPLDPTWGMHVLRWNPNASL